MPASQQSGMGVGEGTGTHSLACSPGRAAQGTARQGRGLVAAPQELPPQCPGSTL